MSCDLWYCRSLCAGRNMVLESGIQNEPWRLNLVMMQVKNTVHRWTSEVNMLLSLLLVILFSLGIQIIVLRLVALSPLSKKVLGLIPRLGFLLLSKDCVKLIGDAWLPICPCFVCPGIIGCTIASVSLPFALWMLTQDLAHLSCFPLISPKHSRQAHVETSIY